MHARFSTRVEAGRLLAEKLLAFAGREDAIVLGLPRGGVPVADAVARRLGLELDVFLVRKLGVPWQPELAMGAIATGNVRVLNDRVVDSLGLGKEVIDAVAERETLELIRREKAYRGTRPSCALAGRAVIVIDDGIATGSTVRAAIAALRRQKASLVVAAAPVIPRDTFARLQAEADEVAAIMVPEQFSSVGEWYADFTQTTDQEVRSLLTEAQALRLKATYPGEHRY
jgi:putative phosphoribosyl transferase